MASHWQRAVDRADSDDLGVEHVREEIYCPVPGACAHA
jgi:hypothetical protein